MDVSSRGSLDTACISAIYVDLMLRRWAFRAELDSPPPPPPRLRILPKFPGFHLGVVGVESSSAEVVVAEVGPSSELDSEANFKGIRSIGGTRAVLSTLFLF